MSLNVHGTALVIGTTGLILLGPSGIGKSSMALRLLEGAQRAGHFATLLSDDQVFLKPINGRVIARAPDAIKGRIELRGSGIGRLDAISETVLRFAVELVVPDAARRIPEENRRWRPFDGVDCPLHSLDYMCTEPFFALRSLVDGFPVWR